MGYIFEEINVEYLRIMFGGIYNTKYRDINRSSFLLWDIHHDSDTTVFAPLTFTNIIIIGIFSHLGSISFIYALGENIIKV